MNKNGGKQELERVRDRLVVTLRRGDVLVIVRKGEKM